MSYVMEDFFFLLVSSQAWTQSAGNMEVMAGPGIITSLMVCII